MKAPLSFWTDLPQPERKRPDPSLYPDWSTQNPIAAAILELSLQVGRLADRIKT